MFSEVSLILYMLGEGRGSMILPPSNRQSDPTSTNPPDRVTLLPPKDKVTLPPLCFNRRGQGDPAPSLPPSPPQKD